MSAAGSACAWRNPTSPSISPAGPRSSRVTQPRGLRVAVEPGDYLVKDAGLLLVQVNTVEDKAGTRFVGVNAGLGILNLLAYYRIPYVVAPLSLRPGAAPSE